MLVGKDTKLPLFPVYTVSSSGNLVDREPEEKMPLLLDQNNLDFLELYHRYQAELVGDFTESIAEFQNN
ncbi:hypothetical protein ES705_47020 [subsurface metagenome]